MTKQNKIILHIDMNSYFASVEQQANPFLRGKPIGVTGKKNERSVIAAASIEAKRQAAKTAMSTGQARIVCPNIQFVTGDPEKYGHVTKKFNQILSEVTDRVEQFSVDESFIDITDTAKDYFGAICIAQTLKARIREELGERITCSVGIAPNKLLAKLGSDMKKPDGLVVIKPSDVNRVLASISLDDFCGIGKRLTQRLDNIGITNVLQLAEYPIDELVAEFGINGYVLHNMANGIDESDVVPDITDPKSMGHSYTLPADTWNPYVIKNTLFGLADRVAWRLRKANYSSQCIHVGLRYGDFTGRQQQITINQGINDGQKLFQTAWGIIRRWPLEKPVRLVSVSAGQLTHGPEQINIFPRERKKSKTIKALDKIQTRYGQNSWTRASLLGVKFKARSSGFHFDHEYY